MAAPAMKTLRVSLVDLEITPAGPGATFSGEVWARLTKQVRTVDGQVVVLAGPRRVLDVTGIVNFSVPANDDAGIHADDRGFGVTVGWDLTTRGAKGSTVNVFNTGSTVLVTSASPAVVAFSSLAEAVPTDALSTYTTEAAVDVKIAAQHVTDSSTFVPGVMLVGAGIDPTGATDSTTAIQSLITANPGAILNLPAGTYKITALTLTKGQHLKGAGWQDYRDRFTFLGSAGWLVDANFKGTVLRSTITTGTAITIVDTEVNTGSLSEFILIGPGSGTSTGISTGGVTLGLSVVHPAWRNVKVGNFSTGVKMEMVNEGSFYDLTIHGCTTGLNLVANVNNCAFYLLDVQRNVTGATVTATCVANTFYNPISQGNATGIVLAGIKNTLVNPYGEATSGTWAIDIAGGVGNSVHAPLLSGATDGLRVQAAANDTTITAFGYDGNSAPLVNAGGRTHLQGFFTGVLTDTGVATVVLDAGLLGSPFGVWADYTPALVGAGWSVGDGTLTGKTTKIGKTVHFRGKIGFGTGSTFGSGLDITVPLQLRAAGGGTVTARLMKSGVGYYYLAPIFDSFGATTSFSVAWDNGATHASAPLTATSPLTLAAGDWIEFQGTYEAA